MNWFQSFNSLFWRTNNWLNIWRHYFLLRSQSDWLERERQCNPYRWIVVSLLTLVVVTADATIIPGAAADLFISIRFSVLAFIPFDFPVSTQLCFPGRSCTSCPCFYLRAHLKWMSSLWIVSVSVLKRLNGLMVNWLRIICGFPLLGWRVAGSKCHSKAWWSWNNTCMA